MAATNRTCGDGKIGAFSSGISLKNFLSSLLPDQHNLYPYFFFLLYYCDCCENHLLLCMKG